MGHEGNKVYQIEKGDLSEFSSWGSNKVKIIDGEQSSLKTEVVQAVKIDDIKFNKKVSLKIKSIDFNRTLIEEMDGVAELIESFPSASVDS